MTKAQTSGPVLPIVVVGAAFVAVCVAALLISDVRVLACLTSIAIGVGVGCHFLFPVGGDPKPPVPGVDPLARSLTDSRSEVLGAMSILQQEIRLLQSSSPGAGDKKALRDEVSHLAAELAALKQVVQTRKS